MLCVSGVLVDKFFLYINVHAVTMEVNLGPSCSDDLPEWPSAYLVDTDKANLEELIGGVVCREIARLPRNPSTLGDEGTCK